MAKDKYITFRSDVETLQLFDDLMKADYSSRAEEARLVFSTGIKNRLLQIAIQKYRNNEISVGKAAEIAKISVPEMLLIMEEKNIKYNLDTDAVIDYIKKIKSAKQ